MTALGALLALVGALVVVAVPDASAAGLTLCCCGLCCCGFALTRTPTLGPGSSGHNLTERPDDFSTAQVEP